MIALYAIIDHPTAPMPPLGRLALVPSRDLAAVCGPLAKGEVTAETLWQHERIVEALMDDRDVVPVRYGTSVSDEVAAARALEDRHDDFAASLERVRGAVELAIRVFSAGDAPRTARPSQEPVTGTEYLRARAGEAAAESDAAAIVHEPLARAARAATVARVTLPGERLRAAYLVDRSATQSFSARVRDLQEANPQLTLTCTGPWPPYSFVSP